MQSKITIIISIVFYLQKLKETDHCSVFEEYIESSSISRSSRAGLLLGLISTSEQTAYHVDEKHTDQQCFEQSPTTNTSLLLLLLLLLWLRLDFSILNK